MLAPDALTFVTWDWLAALGTVIVIDLLLSADNAVVIGLAAAGLPPDLRRRAIVIGIGAATVLRIGLALVTFHLLTIVGLTLAGGLLLLWVCWKMWREIQAQAAERRRHAEAKAGHGMTEPDKRPNTLGRALVAIIVADVSMALDNVLAVAGAAREHFEVLIAGLVLSIVLMAVAASFIAKILERHHWLAYFGLAIIAYVAVDMVWRGTHEVIAAVAE